MINIFKKVEKTKLFFFVLALLFITLVLYFPSDNKTSSIIESDREGWNLYTNYVGKFSIQFPEELHIHEESKKEPDDFFIGSVCFYKSFYKDDCGGGFRIVYAIPYLDGKGGGCSDENRRPIEILGQEQDVCVWETGFNTDWYSGHPEEQVDIWPTARDVDSDMIDTVVEMMKTFEYIIGSDT